MSDASVEGRLKAKVAIIVGAGQTPGDTIGNGRATALVFARAGAKIFAVDRDIDRAQETVDLIIGEEGEATPFAADITREEDCIALAKACVQVYGRIDILHKQMWGSGEGIRVRSISPRPRGTPFTIRICSVSRLARSLLCFPLGAEPGIAAGNAQYGIRVNAIMPGLMNTPMAIEGRSQAHRASINKSSSSSVMRASPSKAAWGAGGTRPTRPCSWLRRRPGSSRASFCR